ncbi:MAG: hypothetical protein KY467_18885, partial [Gemmatimonadetes bacterium]|nr:hypothetical protein [Gemmatimonadota bacterium]
VAHTRSTDLWAFRGVDGRDYVYTGTWGGCAGCIGNRLFVWDVTDPARPTLTDSVLVDAQSINDVAVNEAGTLAAFGRRGAESRRNGVVLLDLADPAHPRQVADYWETVTGGVQAVFFSGDLLYVVHAGAAELVVLDVGNPADPRPVSRWSLQSTPSRYLSDVHVHDGLAYLSYWDDGLVILDVGKGIRDGTPQRPRMLSQVRYRTEWRNQHWGHTHYAFPYVNRAGRRYVFVGDAILPPGADFNRRMEIGGLLHVFDATDPERPVEVATYEVQGRGISKFWVQNDTLYLGSHNGGLRAVEVSGPLRGRLQRREVAVLATGDENGFIPNLTFTWAAMPHNGLVFATDFNSGLWVTRLVAPPAP